MAIYRLLLWLTAMALPVAPLAAQSLPDAIHVMRVDGAAARRLVVLDGYTDQQAPRWSPDGKQILFHATGQDSRAAELFVVDADGNNLRKLGPGARADWSPDGAL